MQPNRTPISSTTNFKSFGMDRSSSKYLLKIMLYTKLRSLFSQFQVKRILLHSKVSAPAPEVGCSFHKVYAKRSFSLFTGKRGNSHIIKNGWF
jgi:hypothetical protein